MKNPKNLRDVLDRIKNAKYSDWVEVEEDLTFLYSPEVHERYKDALKALIARAIGEFLAKCEESGNLEISAQDVISFVEEFVDKEAP